MNAGTTVRGRGAHASSVWRWPVLGFVVAALLCAGLVDATVGTPATRPPATLASAAAPVGSESSSWYCTGITGTPSGTADGTLYLVNVGPAPVTGTVHVVSSTGTTGSMGVTVPGGEEVAVSASQVVQGAWLAATVDLDGGGVTVSEVVEGPLGWATAPCAATTSPSWYFASGATDSGNTLVVSVFNPTTTVAVVDLTFVTPSGPDNPQPFEGLVIAPGAVIVVDVGTFVQNQTSVSTVVDARSGRVVATELQEHDVDGLSGLSLRLGSPILEPRWTLPRSVNVTGGLTTVVVFNPASVAQTVTVRVQLPSGPVSPYTTRLAAGSTWSLVTSGSTRIPANTDFATTVTSTDGPGVVVDRIVRSSSAGAVPQWGAVSAVGAAATEVPSGRWIVASPAVPASPAVAGAAPFALDLENPGLSTVTVSVDALTSSGDRQLGKVPLLRIPPGAFTVVEPVTVGAAGADPLALSSTGPLAAMEDATPAGMPGVVALPAVPQR